MSGALFHTLPSEVAEAQRLEGDARVFTGDGTAYLRVPGLKNLNSVQMGVMVMPLVFEMELPEYGRTDRYITTEVPTVQVAQDSDETPVLMRSVYSNDGIWQKGAEIIVRGEWEDTDDTAKPMQIDADVESYIEAEVERRMQQRLASSPPKKAGK